MTNHRKGDSIGRDKWATALEQRPVESFNESMEDIICRKCKTPKHPCLFRPSDVKAAVRRPDGKLAAAHCRECWKQVNKRYEIKPVAAPWKQSMRAIFARDLSIREFPTARRA